MKIVIIHGQSHKGSTYHIARSLAEKTGGDITEFFLPRDFGEFCVGCTSCIMKSETLCPHHKKLESLTEAIDKADILIFASPVYVYHVTGAMKALLDHYGYRWIVHRPEGSMFTKQAVCISTAAGSGTKSTNKDIADSLFYWGVGKIYKYGMTVSAMNWDGVSEKKKAAIEKATDSLAAKLVKKHGRIKPGIKTRCFFFIFHLIQRKGWNEVDAKYWQEKGWTGKKRPWK